MESYLLFTTIERYPSLVVYAMLSSFWNRFTEQDLFKHRRANLKHLYISCFIGHTGEAI